MSHRPSRVRVRRLALGVSLALLAATLAVPATAEDVSDKSFIAVFNTDGKSYEVELTNTSVGGGGLTLGSARITTTPETGDPSTETLRRLDIAPGDSKTLLLAAPFECGVTSFHVEATQSNNFNGTGNDLDLDVDNSVLSVAVPCAPAEPPLFLSFATQPSDTKVDSAITPAPAVQIVEKVNGDNVKFPKSGVEIEMTLVDGSLSGTSLKVTTNSDGLATFNDLRVSPVGNGYVLTAAADDLTSVDSDPFNVLYDISTCDARTLCESTADPIDDFKVAASGTAQKSGGSLSIGAVDALDEACMAPDGVVVNGLPTGVILDGQGLTGKQVVFAIGEELRKFVPNNGVSTYQICAEPLGSLEEKETLSFVDRYTGDVVVGQAEYDDLEDKDGFQIRGFLPDCKSGRNGVPAPCVAGRSGTDDGGVTITMDFGSRFKTF